MTEPVELQGPDGGSARATGSRAPDRPGRDHPRARRFDGRSWRSSRVAASSPCSRTRCRDRARPSRPPPSTARRHRLRSPPPDDGRDRERGHRGRRARHAVQLPGLVARRIADRGHRHDRQPTSRSTSSRHRRTAAQRPTRSSSTTAPTDRRSISTGRRTAEAVDVPDDRAGRARAAHRPGRRERARRADPVGLATLLGVGEPGASARPQRGRGRRRLLRHDRSRWRGARTERRRARQLPGPRGHSRRAIPGLQQPADRPNRWSWSRPTARPVMPRRSTGPARSTSGSTGDELAFIAAERGRTRREPAHRATPADRRRDRRCPDAPRGLGRGILLVARRRDARGAPARPARRRQRRA